MKKLLTATAIFALSFSVLTGCIKDSYKKTYTYTYYEPVYKTTQEVRDNIRSNSARNIEKPGKIYVRGNYIFLNDMDKGIHVIDNSNPAHPRNLAFIDIPGNVDLAVKGNTLYADLYTDLVSIDISNPLNISVNKIVEGVFPERYWNSNFIPQSGMVIAGWNKRDTTISESGDLTGFLNRRDIYLNYTATADVKSFASVSPVGKGGSMARFTIANNRLYSVGTSDLRVFDISNSSLPVSVGSKHIGWNIETIYPFRDNLFIGSSNGMFIFNISNPDNPVQTGQFSHVESCDPVIADDNYAYVTLRTGTSCRGAVNQLEVLNLTSLTNPTLTRSYPMTNPHGLSKDDNTLFICDGKDGLKVYDAANVNNLTLLKTIAGIETYDAITLGGIVLVVAKDGLYQYDYSNLSNIRLVSRIGIEGN